VYRVMNLRVPLSAGSFLSSLGHLSFSGRTLLHGVILCSGMFNILPTYCFVWIAERTAIVFV
jgi:hypothetical protein